MTVGGVYYNEFDPYAAQWLENLIAAGHLPKGVVDRRSIVEVQPDDLRGFVQCHFFAGIGGWPLALRLAGWPDDRPVWTGSCPCQPFSAAGKQKGETDARHLWPEFLRLILEWEVPTIFGEQVASALGREWLVGVSADLEDLDYVVGAADLCAAGVGAPHIRQRLFWVADANEGQRRWLTNSEERQRDRQETRRQQGYGVAQSGGVASRLADADGGLAGDGGLQPSRQHGQQQEDGRAVRLADDDSQRRGIFAECDGGATGGRGVQQRPDPDGRGGTDGLGDAGGARSGRDARTVPGAQREGEGQRREPRRVADESVAAGATGGLGDADDERPQGRHDGSRRSGSANQWPAGASGVAGFWSQYDIVHCTDGKARRFEPGSFPLAHGISNRVGRLRAYGNAIVPQLAAEFILAWQEVKERSKVQSATT